MKTGVLHQAFVAAVFFGLQVGQTPALAKSDGFDWEVRVTAGAKSDSTSPWMKLSENPDAAKVAREFQGNIEYRTTFEVPGSERPFGVYIGQIGEVDRVYVNGHLVGQTGGFPPTYQNFSDVFREYAIPSTYLKAGASNELLIHTFSRYVGLKGIKPDLVEVGDHFDLQKRQYWKTITWTMVRLGIPALCLFLSLLFIPWFSSKADRPQNAIIPIIGIAAFSYALGNSRVLFHVLSELLSYKILVISAITGWVFAHLFGLRTSQLKSRIINGLLVGSLILFPTLLIFSTDFVVASKIAKFWIGFSLPLSILITSYILLKAPGGCGLVQVTMVFLTFITANDVLHSLRYIQTMIVLDLGFSGILVAFMTTQIVAYRRGFFEFAERRAEMLWSDKFVNLARQVAHDIRSPLQSMVFAAQDLKNISAEKLGGLESGSNPVNILQLGLARINSILGKLISEFRGPEEVESLGASGVRLTLLDKAVRDVLTEHRWGDEKSAQFVVDGLDDLPPTWAVFDPVDLQAAVSNVIRNAVEAFESIKRKDKVIKVYAVVEGGAFRLSVEDNGSGIAQENLSKIFDKGFTAGKKQGTGLGLFQVKQTLDRIEGKVEVVSTPGVGTKVTILIPTEKTPSVVSEVIEYDPQAPVYFVDDDPSVQQFWKGRIAKEGLNPGLSFVKSSLKQLDSADIGQGTVVLDHFFRDDVRKGLEWFRDGGTALRGYLCTTAYDDPEIQKEAQTLGLKVIPKPLLSRVQLRTAG